MLSQFALTACFIASMTLGLVFTFDANSKANFLRIYAVRCGLVCYAMCLMVHTCYVQKKADNISQQIECV